MSDGWKATISVGIDNDCPMEFRVLFDGTVEFLTAHDTEEFDMSFQFDAFQQFIELGSATLAHAKAQLAAPHTNADDPDDATVVIVA